MALRKEDVVLQWKKAGKYIPRIKSLNVGDHKFTRFFVVPSVVFHVTIPDQTLLKDYGALAKYLWVFRM